jgi:hypothetical protein
MNLISKISFGVGDRFAHQAKAQLKAFISAKKAGLEITPVWNKSHREHTTINSSPAQTREMADRAVKELNWTGPYLCDADHINLTNVDHFIPYCDFYTIDVADYIGKKVSEQEIDAFYNRYKNYTGEIKLPGLTEKYTISDDLIKSTAAKYLFAVKEAGKIYKHITSKKAENTFITEISMDETDEPQTPFELFFILAAIAQEGIPVVTIAPKFSGRFNKGVDYVGNLQQFKKEFEQDVAVLQLAVEEFKMNPQLKLSVHSGSDKFSIYPVIKETIKKFDTGLHIKTAGTTWLEELIGLAESGGLGLEIAKKIYQKSLDKFDELCAPYATVIDIDKNKLPTVKEIESWDGASYANTLRHDAANLKYNPNFRQLLHVGYKIAAQFGNEYLQALKENEKIIEKNVVDNLFNRHIKPLLLD